MHMPFRTTLTATAVTLALGSFAGIAAADQNVAEARQESQIGTTYALNPHLRNTNLKVSVEGDKATLTGIVDEDVSRDLAEQIALGVNGIKNVDNQIKVQEGYTPPARSGNDRSFGEVVDDATITAAVKSKLLWGKNTGGMATNVDTVGGKVTLAGTVDDGASKELATRVAMNTRGVTAVDNRLVVQGAKLAANASAKGKAASAKGESAASKAKDNMSDGWITTKLKSTYMYSSNVKGSNISVSTESGIVTLTGEVDSSAERALAIAYANNIRGVKSVNSKGLKAL